MVRRDRSVIWQVSGPNIDTVYAWWNIPQMRSEFGYHTISSRYRLAVLA